jgi:hypothetical protein
MRNFIVFLGIICLCNSYRAQWKEVSNDELANRIKSIDNSLIEKGSFSYQAQYTFFNQWEGNDTAYASIFSMTYLKEKNLLNINQFGRLIIQDENVQIICDTSLKQIFIQEPNPSFTQVRQTTDFNSLLTANNKIEKQIKGSFNLYRVHFDSVAKYAMMELWFDKSNQLKKYILYSGKKVFDDSFEDENFIKPRMEFTINELNLGVEVKNIEISYISEYISDLKELKPSKTFSDFEVVDMRYNKDYPEGKN